MTRKSKIETATPGPWRFYVNNPDTPSDGYVIESQTTHQNVALTSEQGQSFAEVEANAKLITAAPEMADALELELERNCTGKKSCPDPVHTAMRAALRAAGRIL